MIATYALAEEPRPGKLAALHDVRAVHITSLLPDGSDRERGGSAKITIASPCTYPIVLAPPNDLLGLAITEGVEAALTVHQATGLGAWAAGAAPFMPALADAVLDYIEEVVTIYAHNDGGRHHALVLADRLAARDFEVRIEGLPK